MRFLAAETPAEASPEFSHMPRTAVLNQGNFAPQGTFGSYWTHFDCHNWAMVAATWHQVGRGQDAARHPVHRMAPSTKD